MDFTADAQRQNNNVLPSLGLPGEALSLKRNHVPARSSFKALILRADLRFATSDS